MANPQFGKYQLIKKLATGGMAEVFLAKQAMGNSGDNRHVVVKRILPHLAEDPEFIQMFQNEARVAAKFSHPNIAQIYDYGEENGTYYIAMEFIHGEDLGRLMRKAWSTGQWIARPLAIRIVASACEGLYYAHTRKDEEGRALKVVHRDISPQNILISFDGSVKLVDFGIAKAADQASMTKSGAIKGKFAYMAPEQAAGKPLDARTDVFAIGLVLYELLTGVRPLKRDSELATLQAALECAIDAPSVVAEVPSELDDVVMRALAKAPDDRYKDARAFQMALEEFLISQRMVASSVQVSELMETLFADRRAEENKLGAPNPSSAESMSAPPAVPEPPGWERPPESNPQQQQSQSQSQPRRSRAAMPEVTGHTDMATPGEGGRPASAEWEAPPASQQQVMPSRRYSNNNSQSGENSGSTAPQRAHQPESTRAKPPTSSLGAYESEIPPPRGSRPLRKSAAMQRIETGRDVEDPEPSSPPPGASPSRRSTSGAKIRRTSSGTEMPAPPPRRSRPQLHALDGDRAPLAKKATRANRQEEAELDRLSGLDQAKKGSRNSLKYLVPVLVVVAIALMAWIFKPGNTLPDGVPVLLTVISNPKTRVKVVSPVQGRQPIDLGDAPLDKASGAMVGDTIILENTDMCIRHEETIQFGEPYKEKIIEKVFGEGKLKLTWTPSALKGLAVYCNNQRIGNLGMGLSLYEGKHTLEIRGDALKAPVQFDVNIDKDKTTTLPKPIDLTPALEK
jgi:serine/threonine protein kinase